MRPRGNRGEVAGELTGDEAILTGEREVYLWDGAQKREIVHIRKIWPHKNRFIFQFDGIGTIDQASRFAGWEVQIPAERRPAAPAGGFYIDDLIGCTVEEKRSGRPIGVVTDFLETGGTALLEVTAGEGREILVPFASAICAEIEPARRVIIVEMPEGLEELNRSK